MRGHALHKRIDGLLRPRPALRYVHPKAIGRKHEESRHDAYLDVAEENAPNYLQWIADMCRPHLGKHVLDVGAGTGAITALYADDREVEAVELSDWCIAALEERFADSPNVTTRQADLFELSGDTKRFDSAVMINVLEHIEDDVAALRTLGGVVRDGGRIIVYVPALNGLYGAYDRKVGHFRRYARWRMVEVMEAAEVAPLVIRYVNALAIPAWLLFSHTNVDRAPSGRLSLWDRTGTPLTRLIESRVHPPLGLNLFCIAEVIS